MEEQTVAQNDQNLEKHKIEEEDKKQVSDRTNLPPVDTLETSTNKPELIDQKEADNDLQETKENISKTDTNTIEHRDIIDNKTDDKSGASDTKDAKIKEESLDNNKIEDAVDAKQIASNSQVDANPFSWGSSSSGDKKKGPVSVPTFIDDKEYVVSGQTKKLIILNQKHFHTNLGLTERKGTERDEDAIISTFKPLGWDIDVHNDLNLKQVRNVIMDVQTAEVDEFAALAIFILSHGEDNGTVFAYDGGYRIYNDVLSPLAANKCPALAGRPKMIFVQACQGRDVDSGTDVSSYRRSGSVTSHDAISTVTYKIPNYADFLIYQASFCGHYSFRNSSSGSWFVQSLCSKINESRSDEALFDVLLEVSRGIAIEKESFAPNTPQLDMKKQVPLLYSTMLRKIYLKDRGSQKDANMDKPTGEASINADMPTVQASTNGSVEKSGSSLDEHAKDRKVNGTSSSAKNKNKNKGKESCVCM